MSEYEKVLIEKLKEARPKNKLSSHKQYARCIKLLNDRLNQKLQTTHEFENIDFVKDRDLIINLTSDLSDSTKRNYFTACANVLRLEDKTDELDEIINYYETKVNDFNDKYKEEQKSGIISDKQKPAFDVKLDGLLDMMYNMERDLDDPTTHIAYMVYNILLHHQLRNEVGTLEKIGLSQFNGLKKDEVQGKNWLVIPSNIYKKPFKIVSTEYKTDKKHGTKTVEIKNPILRKKLLNYIRQTGNVRSGPLFVYDGKPVNEKILTDILLYQSKKYLPQSNSDDNPSKKFGIGTTMFAKIVLSHEFEEINGLMKQKAMDRGHSIGVQSSIYIKKSE